MGIISEEEREGGDLCRAVRVRVMLEFCRGEESGPFMGVVCVKDTEVSLDLLISSFSLSISLGVVGSREADIILENLSKFPSKG